MIRLVATAALTVVIGVNACLALEISSPGVGDSHVIATKYSANGFGCLGRNVSLPLAWKDVPGKAKSLAIMMLDPDAGSGKGFLHWLVVNLPPSVTSLPEGAGNLGDGGLPSAAVQLPNDAGLTGYFGPCPPHGDPPHHYVITIYAVSKPAIGVAPGTANAAVTHEIIANTIDKASIIYTYQR
jgi:Raf kinase inhibitor-like YbhB/YbcL family protein